MTKFLFQGCFQGFHYQLVNISSGHGLKSLNRCQQWSLEHYSITWPQEVNSRALGRCSNNFICVIFKCMLQIKFMITDEIALTWMLQNTFDHMSTLVQVMAWCQQATSHYMSQYWPRSSLLLGHNKSIHKAATSKFCSLPDHKLMAYCKATLEQRANHQPYLYWDPIIIYVCQVIQCVEQRPSSSYQWGNSSAGVHPLYCLLIPGPPMLNIHYQLRQVQGHFRQTEAQ